MDIYIDSNNDITLDGRDLRLTTSDEDLVQKLRIHLQFFLGEWFLDTSKGIPYTQAIFETGHIDINKLNSYMRSRIKEIDGVEIINSFEVDFDRDERIFSITTKINNTEFITVTI